MDGYDRLPARVASRSARGLWQDAPAAELSADLRARLADVVEARPNWDGVVTIAGNGVHHWVHVSAGEAISMMGFLTPHLMDSLGGAEAPDPTAVSDTLSRPERLAAQLRSAQLAGDRAALTGHLIGAELAAGKVYWLGQEVLMMGQGPYARALREQGADVRLVD